MLLFDWKKVFDTADGNIAICNTIMEMLINQQIPRNKFDRIYKYSIKNLQVLVFFFMETSYCTIPISIHKKNYAYITHWLP